MAKIDELLGLEVNTDRFLKLNNTYFGEVVGFVEANDGKMVV